MLGNLLTTGNEVTASLAVFAVVARSVLRSWFAYRQKWIAETSRTQRLSKVIEGARPHQRAEILRAWRESEDE